MIESVVALLMFIQAERQYNESVSYKCYKGKAETEVYMGEKSIKALIIK